jgi:hypothetical protein
MGLVLSNFTQCLHRCCLCCPRSSGRSIITIYGHITLDSPPLPQILREIEALFVRMRKAGNPSLGYEEIVSGLNEVGYLVDPQEISKLGPNLAPM